MIDLNVHTNNSLDGNLEVNDVLNKCYQQNINVVSIADHNNINAYYQIDQFLTNYKGTIVYGMEADALINGKTFDIMCYGFNPEPIKEWSSKQYLSVAQRQEKIFKALEEHCKENNIAYDNSTPFDSSKEYAHEAMHRMLLAIPETKEYMSKFDMDTVDDFYRKSTTDEDSPFYIDMGIVWPTIDQLNDIMHKNGGLIFLAHPSQYQKFINTEKLLEIAAPYIDGIEISSKGTSKEEMDYLYKYAKEHNLLISAGSNFHGNHDNSNVGVKDLTSEMETDILNWIYKVNTIKIN